MAAKPKRSYGTGSLWEDRGNWYGKWRIGDRQVKRKIGPARQPGTRDGLTKAQAEAALRKLIETEAPAPVRPDVTVEDAASRLLAERKRKGRKPTTLATYRSIINTHVLPTLGKRPLDRVSREDIEKLIEAMQDAGKRSKTITNTVTLLFQICDFGRRKGWCRSNPCEDVERPEVEAERDIRFLDAEELEALLRAVDVGAEPFGATDRVLFLTAAMTGLRQGELLALRWRDIDWKASRVRVRRNYVRGHWGTPKSKRGTRSVPLIDRVAGELDRHFKASAYQDDDALVFCHPQTGDVLDHSGLVRRFKAALKAAGVRPVRFHDLRHTFGTRMATRVPMRTLQEWMGHRSISTTEIYADYAPSAHERELAERAFAGPGTNSGTKLSETQRT